MTVVVRDDGHPLGPLVNPGRIGGLRDVFRRRYLLKLIVRKELRVRYAASSVGLLWSYVKPAVRFLMYWQVIELLLPKALENRPLHIFAGMIMVSFLSDCLTSGTKSVLKNKALVRKINLPREMFPVASVLVSMYHMVPMYVIAIFGCIVAGWSADPGAVAAALLAFLIAAVWGLATALFLSAWNVYYRDIGNITEVINTVITWTVPMIYPYSAVRDQLSGIAQQIYLANPLCIAVLLNDRAFWVPTLSEPHAAATELPPDLWQRGVIMFFIGCVFLWIAQRVFSRLEGGFAEQL